MKNHNVCVGVVLAALAGVSVMLSGATARAELKVVATLPDLAAIAHEVGGDAVTVEALVAPSEDPHYVDPRPSLLLKLNKADMLIVNGVELESGWLPPLQTQARNAAIGVGGAGYVDASRFVTLIGAGGAVDRSMGDIHPGGNPHFTFDPRAARGIALGIAERMGKLDPANARKFKSNADRFVGTLDFLIQKQARRFGTLDAAHRRVVVYHPSLPYLLDWLKVAQVATVEPKPGIAPTPGQVASVMKSMKAERAAVIVQEEYYPRKTSETLARMVTGKVVVLHGGTRFADGETYTKHVEQLADALYEALSDKD